MVNKVLKTGIISMLLLFIGLLLFILIPRRYDVPVFSPRPGTEYWHLTTGSTIGYSKVKSLASEEKAPLIYLHGGPGGLITDGIISFLSPLSDHGHDLYFYDQVGSGHSSRLDDISEYTVTRHRDDLAEIIDLLDHPKVILIAKSWGACLAINYLQDHAHRVESLVLTGPGPILPIDTSLARRVPPDSLRLLGAASSNRLGNYRAQNWKSIATNKWARIFSAKLTSDHEADQFYTHLNQELNKATVCAGMEAPQAHPGGGYYSHIKTVESMSQVEDGRKKLNQLPTPMLLLRGQCDNQKWGYTQEYQNLFPNSKLIVIDNVGHSIINGKKEEYYQLIEQFISRGV